MIRSSSQEESSEKVSERVFIEETRLSIIRAREYLKQVQAEISCSKFIFIRLPLTTVRNPLK